MRMPIEDRRAAILAVALPLAEAGHYRFLTRDEVAAAAECSPALVSMHFGSMESFRDELMREAIKRRNARVVAQGLASRCSIAESAPEFLRVKATEALSPQS